MSNLLSNSIKLTHKLKTKSTIIVLGIAMGIANIIPGISGGTIAVILNIYDALISAINTCITNSIKQGPKGLLTSKKEILFLFQIGIGAIIGIIMFSKICAFLLETFPKPTNFCLMGLILGSIPVIIKCHHNMAYNTKKSVFFILGCIPLLLLSYLPPSDLLEPSLSLTSTSSLSLGQLVFIGVAGLIAAASMIIPGLSGSLLLLIIGIYPDLIQAISDINLKFLTSLGIGALIGLILISKLINWCLTHHPAYTYYGILGLIIGSIPNIWPGLPTTLLSSLINITTLFLGILLSLQLGKKISKQKTPIYKTN